jgi:hypothetical protein
MNASSGGFTVAVISAITLLALLLHRLRAVRIRRRDREAHDRLQLLQSRTCTPGIDLLELSTTQWASMAGQFATGIDVATGAVVPVWLPQARIPEGSLILVRRDVHPHVLLDWMAPEEVKAAYRSRRRGSRGAAGAPAGIRPCVLQRGIEQPSQQSLAPPALE